MKYIQTFRNIYKSVKAHLKEFWACSFHHGYAIVPLPSEEETAAYKQQVAEIMRLLEAGYQVTIVSEPMKKQCECCKVLKAFYEAQLKNQTNLKPLTEHV